MYGAVVAGAFIVIAIVSALTFYVTKQAYSRKWEEEE